MLWTVGNGSKRIVLARKGSAVTSTPTDLVSYTANENFGQGQELAPGEFVIADHNYNYADVKNLEPSTTYHFAVFEYNADALGRPDYLVTSYLATSASTATAPTLQAAISTISNIQATTATLNLVRGDGGSRIIIMKQGAPVNVVPQDLVKYTSSSSFGSSQSLINDGNYVMYSSSGVGNISISGLQANTTYYVSVFEFNGAAEPVYLQSSPGTNSFTTADLPGASVPTVAASNAIVENVEGNKLKLKWTNGNGEKRIVVMRKGSAVNFVPASGTNYSAAAAFGTGTDLGNGNYVVLNANSNTVELTNLEHSSTYHFSIFELNGTGTLIRYLTATSLNGTVQTLAAPAIAASNPVATPGSSSLLLSWTNGNGSNRLVVMKEGNSAFSTPANFSVYPANSIYKNGSQVAAGEYVVYTGAGNTVNVTGLAAGSTYYFSIFEYNGNSAPVYNQSLITGSATISGTLPVELLYFNARSLGQDISVNWATASEFNNAFFTVERSTDGQHFTAISQVTGAGNSTQKITYTYTDKEAPAGKIYYRLKQTDIDGKITYSSVQLVNRTETAAGIAVYPNPVQQQFKIDLPLNISEARITLVNMQGQQVLTQKIVSGQYLNIGSLSNGMYQLRVETKEKTFTSKIMKR